MCVFVFVFYWCTLISFSLIGYVLVCYLFFNSCCYIMYMCLCVVIHYYEINEFIGCAILCLLIVLVL